MWKDCETFSSPAERMKRRSLRIFRHSIAKGINFSERRVRSRAALVQWKFTAKDATHAEVSAIISSAEKRTGTLNGRGRIRSQKRQRKREERRQRAKKAIIRENTTDCHPQSSLLDERIFATLFPLLLMPLPEKLHRPLKDFMTNLFNDRGPKLPAKVRVFVISRYTTSNPDYLLSYVRFVDNPLIRSAAYFTINRNEISQLSINEVATRNTFLPIFLSAFFVSARLQRIADRIVIFL